MVSDYIVSPKKPGPGNRNVCIFGSDRHACVVCNRPGVDRRTIRRKK